MRRREVARAHRAAASISAPPARASSLRGVADLQARAGNAAVGSLIEARSIAAVAAPGRPLEIGLRQEMERRLRTDLSSVRIHTDERASAVAAEMGAHAFTIGDQIVFRGDMYRPDRGPGKRMLAHELAHVVQQRGGGRGVPGGLVARDDPTEKEADRIASRVASLPPERTRTH